MVVLSEKKEDQERVEALHKQRRITRLTLEALPILGGFAIGKIIHSHLKNNRKPNWIGIGIGTGIIGALVSFWAKLRMNHLEKELEKPENSNVILTGKPLNPIIDKLGLYGEPLKSEAIPQEQIKRINDNHIEIKENWGEGIAKQKAEKETSERKL